MYSGYCFSVFILLTHLMQQLYEEDTIMLPILQRVKLRHTINLAKGMVF